MIVKRKLFTRGEKQALAELYKATKGFKELPRTGNPRDVLRLQKLATDLKKLSVGNSKNFDRENAKKLLESANLPLSAKEVDHVIDKYTNKRALARLRKSKQHQIIDVPDSPSLKESGSGLSQLAKSELRILGFRIGNRKSKKSAEIIDKLNEIAKNREITVKPGKVSKAITASHKDTGEIMASNKRLPKEYRKEFREVNISKRDVNSPEILAHELGHMRDYMSPVQQMRHDFKLPRPNLKSHRSRNIRKANKNLIDFSEKFSKIAAENNANSYGEAMIRRVNGNVDRMRSVAKYNQDNYIGGARVDLVLPKI